MDTGVYAIRFLADGRVYVGSAATSLKARWKKHRTDLAKGTHDNSYLQATWNKYGEQAFEFTVLELCPPDRCIEREQFWIDTKQSAIRRLGFNLAPRAGSVLGLKHSAESRARASEACRGRRLSEETKRKISEIQTGRKLHAAWCKAVSEGLKGRKRVFGESWRKAMSESRKGKKKTPEHVSKSVETKRRNRIARRMAPVIGQIMLPLEDD